MIRGSWDRRLYGIPAFGHPRAAHPWASIDSVPGQLPRRPSSNPPKLRPVSEGNGIIVDPPSPSPCSQISRLQFASRDETMTLMTAMELESRLRDPLSLSTIDSSSLGIQDRVPSSEQSFLATQSTLVLPQQPACAMPRPNGPATADYKKAAGRPLPEVPSYTQSRPLPPRPTKMDTVPGWRELDWSVYPPRQEFVLGCSKDHSIASRPVSDSGLDALAKERPNHNSTPEDNPSMHLISAPAGAILPSVTPPPTPPSPPPLIVPLRPAMPALQPVDAFLPTSIDLVAAAGLTIVGENGEQILFGSLFRDRKVVVVFICHFWCLCCQNYARSVLNSVTPEILGHKGVDLVVVGNGSHGAIKTYKSAPRSPFRSDGADLTEFQGWLRCHSRCTQIHPCSYTMLSGCTKPEMCNPKATPSVTDAGRC